MFLHIFSAIEDNHNWVHHPSCWKTRPFSWKKLSMTTSLRVWKLVASLRNTLKRLAGALIKHYLVTIQFIAEKNSAKNHTWKHTKNQHAAGAMAGLSGSLTSLTRTLIFVKNFHPFQHGDPGVFLVDRWTISFITFVFWQKSFNKRRANTWSLCCTPI